MMATRIEHKGNTVVFNGKKETFANILDAPDIIAKLERKPVREKGPVCEAVMDSAVEQAMAIIRGEKS